MSIWARRGFEEREVQRDAESRRVVTNVTARVSRAQLGAFGRIVLFRSRSKEKLVT